MNDAQFVEIGYIQRTHGIKGEMQVVLNDTCRIDPNDMESVFVEIDGIPVPFFILSFKEISGNRYILHFDEITSIEEADTLVGYRLLVPSSELPQTDEIFLSDLVGYSLYASGELVGTITHYRELGLNALFSVSTSGGTEVLIPATDELVVSVDVDGKVLEMDLPEGLID